MCYLISLLLHLKMFNLNTFTEIRDFREKVCEPVFWQHRRVSMFSLPPVTFTVSAKWLMSGVSGHDEP